MSELASVREHRLSGRGVLFYTLIGLGVFGFVARIVISLRSYGTNDTDIWFGHARHIAQIGLRKTLETYQDYNHPPLMGYWSVLALKVSGGDTRWFPFFIRLPGLLAEVLGVLILWDVWRRRSGEMAAAKVVALYGWSLTSILICGYHGNTDCTYAGLVLLCAYLFEIKAHPLAAGLALAAALNVKLIPALLVAPILIVLPREHAAKFIAGLTVGAIPFLPFLILCPQAMYRNMMQYGGGVDYWGIEAFIRYGVENARFSQMARQISAIVNDYGKYAVMALPVVASLALRARRRADLFTVCAVSLSLFLILTPGFGPQYLVSVVPVFFAVSSSRAFLYSALAGTFALLDYVYYQAPGRLWRTVFYAPSPMPVPLYGVLAWGTLISFVASVLRRRRLIE